MRLISSVQSVERGSLVTVVNCMSTTGHFIPPLLVFPRKYIKPELMNGTRPGSIHACHPLGWIQSEIFTQWFLHFIKHTKPIKKKSCYLGTGRALLTHTRNLDQRLFSSVNFSPFTSAEALRASDISAVPSLNLQPNPRGGTVNKITSSS